MPFKCTHEQFAKDVAAHKMTVKMDKGIYRHLRFAKPNDGNRSFNIVTVPGRLWYFGDMGSYTFCRIEDMFQFFRHEDINPGYWAEKLESVDDVDGYQEFSEDIARARVSDVLAEFEGDEQEKAELVERLDDEIHFENEYQFRKDIYIFEFANKSLFQDSGECNFKKFTGRYIWACRAIVWGIAQYDAHKAALAEQVQA